MKSSNHLSSAESSEARERARRRQASIAQTFRPNALYDRLLGMDLDMRPMLSPTTQMALAMYEHAKHAYEAQPGKEQP